MRTFEFCTLQFIPLPQEQVFAFFSDATNLEAITPSWLNFQITSPQPIVLREGAVIDYRLRVRGIRFGWRTLIRTWEPPHRFVDEQLRGPYRLWHHEHRFERVDGGTRMEDRVRYAPIGGALINALFVRRDVERIFQYRAQQLEQRFSAPG